MDSRVCVLDLDGRKKELYTLVFPEHADISIGRISVLAPVGAKSIEILSARRPAGVNPDALVFCTEAGTPFDRHNLVNRQLKPTCKKSEWRVLDS